METVGIYGDFMGNGCSSALRAIKRVHPPIVGKPRSALDVLQGATDVSSRTPGEADPHGHIAGAIATPTDGLRQAIDGMAMRDWRLCREELSTAF